APPKLVPDTDSNTYPTRPPQTPAELCFVAVPEGLPQVEGFEIQGELGRGAMGVVYKALQLGLNRLVAIKMIRYGANAAPEDLVRFLAEAEAVAQIHHPNIVQIYSVAKHAGLPFFVLEYLDGGSLGQRIRQGPLAPKEAAEMLELLAQAMDA